MKLDITCSACPEQYDAKDDDGNIIGYLRLRHGHFSARIDGYWGEIVYTAATIGDGVFDDDERTYHLELVKKAIQLKLDERAGACAAS